MGICQLGRNHRLWTSARQLNPRVIVATDPFVVASPNGPPSPQKDWSDRDQRLGAGYRAANATFTTSLVAG